MKAILYSTDCPKCKVLKSKLMAKHIEFEEVNDVQKMAEIGLTSAPFLDIDGRLMDFVEAAKWANDQEVRG